MQEQTSSNSLGERVPKLRFPEFEGGWDSSSMGELGTFTKGAPLSKADITETGTPLILYGELYTTYGDIANTIVRKTDKNVKSECYSISGDVIIPTSGESPEEISTCTCVMQDGVILAGDLNIYRTNNVDGRFLSYEINHIRNREIAKIAQGKSIVHIKADELAKIVIRFPSKAEQSKIIELFSCLDRKIELQKKLIDSLKLYKRGLLSKLFPQKGKGIPQYRFKEFTDVWKQRKVTELGNIYIGLVTTMTAHYTDHGTLLIRNSDIKDGKFVFDSEPIYLDDEFSEVNKSRRHKVGDVITVHTGDVGTSAVITENEANSIGFATIVTRPNKEILDSYYLSVFLNTDKHKNWAVQMSTGDGRTNYNLREYTELIVPVPAVDEQKKIAKFIMTLNNLITLHQRKYNSYKKEKLALLQQMFI